MGDLIQPCAQFRPCGIEIFSFITAKAAALTPRHGLQKNRHVSRPKSQASDSLIVIVGGIFAEVYRFTETKIFSV
jgi:hypothetical protein